MSTQTQDVLRFIDEYIDGDWITECPLCGAPFEEVVKTEQDWYSYLGARDLYRVPRYAVICIAGHKIDLIRDGQACALESRDLNDDHWLVEAVRASPWS